MSKVALHNLGCKVNAYELEVIGQKLKEKGYELVPFEETADIYIINTCTVTNIADRKSRQMLHRAKKKNPNAVVCAMGCYVQTGGEKALEDECIDLAIGNERKSAVVEILETYLAHRDSTDFASVESKTLGRTSVTDINDGVRPYDEMQLADCEEHTRAYIKIQDGCNQFCSYCVIPYARGRVRSRQQENVIAEITALAAKGFHEIVLTGIHISSYGMDFIDKNDGDYLENGKDLRGTAFERAYLLNLIRAAAAVPGIERVRLGSLEPRIITKEFVAALAEIPQICPHFHLSLQSGCDKTLKAMNRHYSAAEYAEKVALLRAGFADVAITTDVIVGFPQEDEKDFLECKKFLEDINFYEMHVFKYSRRAGTVADRMTGQIPESVKSGRSAELLELEARQSKAFRARFIGRTVTMLTEDSAVIDGRTYRLGYTPEYVRLAVPEEQVSESNVFVTGRAEGFLAEDILLLNLGDE